MRGEYRPDPVLVELEGGSSVVLGITSVSPTGLPGIRRRMLSPNGSTGGWIAPSSLAPDAMSALVSISVEARSSGASALRTQRFPTPRCRVLVMRSPMSSICEMARRLHRAPRGRSRPVEQWDAQSGPESRGPSRPYPRTTGTPTVGPYRRTVRRWDDPLTVYDDPRLFEIIPRVAGDEVLSDARRMRRRSVRRRSCVRARPARRAGIGRPTPYASPAASMRSSGNCFARSRAAASRRTTCWAAVLSRVS